MNAPVLLRAPDQDLENLAQAFAECCDIQVWFVNEGWISKQQALDNLQHLIECLNVPGEDRDTAQAIMAEGFAPRFESASGGDLVGRCELYYRRDRWQYVGEPPPADDVRNGDISGKPANKPRRFRLPQATVGAFKYVVSVGDPDYLARWLRDHSDVASDLLKAVGPC